MLLKDIERALQDQKLVHKVVYDLDEQNSAMAANNEYSATDLPHDSARFVPV